ncbi:hypothetical protein OESDEN_00368 [Oesophagostomum dentatum]|uniref:Uncharacterized protein n=1 Tax=Oesophagostomum dentatum TaxID=61180 RepID=A0A0B1TU74_OESDE|nr:hypothetical protein OESDEN_00368 [Oesophagostomum dentatum]
MSKMRLALLSTALFALTSASPAIFNEERIEAMLEKLRRAKGTGEYAINTVGCTLLCSGPDISCFLRRSYSFISLSTVWNDLKYEILRGVT